MKKKILLTLLGLVCALCCMFTLAACGENPDNSGNGGNDGTSQSEKTLTTEQWKSTFVAAQSEKNFSLTEHYIDDEDNTTPGLIFYSYNDSPNEYYSLESASVTKLLIKKADRYYAGTYKNSNYDISELSSSEYSQAETVLFQDVAPLYAILKGLEDSYADFKFTGSGSDADTSYTTYSMSDFSFTVADTEYTALSVNVQIDDDTKSLSYLDVKIMIEDDGKSITDWLHYSKQSAEQLKEAFRYVRLPEFIGKTFELAQATVDKSEYAQYIIGNPNDDTYVVVANAGKTATFNADGTISGDIITSADTKISDFTYTEEYGAITVTNENKVSDPDAVVTLSGGMEYASGIIPKLVLTMKVQIGEEEVTVTFTYFYAE